MARISGVDLPREKRIEIGLTYVYGIGRVRASKILEEAGVNPDTRVKDLTDEEVAKIAKVIDADPEHLVEGDLRREVAMNIKRLKEIGCPFLFCVYSVADCKHFIFSLTVERKSEVLTLSVISLCSMPAPPRGELLSYLLF